MAGDMTAETNKILKNLDLLERDLPISCRPIISSLRSFKKVVSGCFSNNLDPEFEVLIGNFKSDFILLQEYCKEVLDLIVTTSWKIHALLVHLIPFLRLNNVGMSRFAEQTLEATHSDYKKTWKRFKVSETHRDHAKRLKTSVVEYSSRRV
jgi:hypothetical protein